MLPIIEKLLILQHRDQNIRSIQTELKSAPNEKIAWEKRQSTEQAAFDAVKEKVQKLELERKKLEMDAGTKRTTIEKFKTQQAQTRKNEEYQMLTSEIARYEKLIEEVEDAELELMEQGEVAKKELAEAEKILKEAKATTDQHLSEIDTTVHSLQNRLQELEAERKKAAEAVEDENVRLLYERLMKSKGDAAVVPLERDICRGCHIKITTQTSLRVRANKELVTCDNCGRILFEE